MTQLRVLVADDHPIFRKGLVDVISESGEYILTGEATDGAQALAMITDLRPDIAILDINMPELDGLGVLAGCGQLDSEVQCVILTMYDDEEYFRQALQLGAKGYLLKENAVSELLTCLGTVAGGQVYLSPSISWQLAPQAVTKPPESPLACLTDAERRVLRLIADGKTSKEAARELEISYRTVQNHRNNIALKLALKGTNQLLKFAIENKDKL